MTAVKSKVSLLLMLAMVMSLLAACSGGSGESQGGEAAPAGETGAQETPKASGGETAEVVELDMFVNHPWWPLKDWSGSVPEEITKRTGVKLNITVAADEQQLPLMIASGDLPDLIFTASDIERLSNPKLTYAWDELIEQYAPSFQPPQNLVGVNTAPDGKYYTLRNNFSTQEEWEANQAALPNGGGIAVRKDILETLGNPPMNTLQDLESVFAQVKQKYPDFVPLVSDKNWIGGYFAPQFGVVGKWYEDDGNIIHYLRQPETLEFYKFMNRMYREGYMIADNWTFKDDKVDDEFALSGKAFAIEHVVRVADELNAALESQGADYSFQMITPEGGNPRIYNTGIGWSGVFITKKNKHPEASIKFMEFMFSDEGQRLGMWGVEGKDWTLHAEGYPEFQYDRSNADLMNQNGHNWWGLLSASAVTEGLGNYIPGKQVTTAAAFLKKHTEYKPELGLLVTEPDSEEKAIETKLEDMITNERVKVYLAQSEEEAVQAYNNMLDLAEQIGLSKLEGWANEKYGTVKDYFK